MLRITELSMLNVRGVAEASVCISNQITVILGGVGSGKSTIVDSLGLFGSSQQDYKLFEPDTQDYERLARVGAKVMEVEITVQDDKDPTIVSRHEHRFTCRSGSTKVGYPSPVKVLVYGQSKTPVEVLWGQLREGPPEILRRAQNYVNVGLSREVLWEGDQAYLSYLDYGDSLLHPTIPMGNMSAGEKQWLSLVAFILLSEDLATEDPVMLVFDEQDLPTDGGFIIGITNMLQNLHANVQVLVATQSAYVLQALLGDPVDAIRVCQRGRDGTVFGYLDANKTRTWLEKFDGIEDMYQAGYLHCLLRD